MLAHSNAATRPRDISANVMAAEMHIDRLRPAVEAAREYLDIGKSNTEKLIRSGELRVVRIGRKVMIRESEIARFIAAAERRTALSEGAAA